MFNSCYWNRYIMSPLARVSVTSGDLAIDLTPSSSLSVFADQLFSRSLWSHCFYLHLFHQWGMLLLYSLSYMLFLYSFSFSLSNCTSLFVIFASAYSSISNSVFPHSSEIVLVLVLLPHYYHCHICHLYH